VCCALQPCACCVLCFAEALAAMRGSDAWTEMEKLCSLGPRAMDSVNVGYEGVSDETVRVTKAL
jgi:hypothetical protein